MTQAEYMVELDTRYDSPTLTIKDIGEYLGVSRPVATEVMKKHGRQINGWCWRITKAALAKYMAGNKR